MLCVNLVGLVKENKYIKMYRLSNFKLAFSLLYSFDPDTATNFLRLGQY